MWNKYENMYVLDAGKTKMTIYGKFEGEYKVLVMTREEVLALDQILPKDSLLVTEYSHGGCPQKELSLSQPFTAEQLLDWYDKLEEAGITLKLFPQKSTPRALTYGYYVLGLFNDIDFEDVKDDLRDPVMIYHFLQDHPLVSMMNPPTHFDTDPRLEEAWSMKGNMNRICNYARQFKADNYEVHESGYILPEAEYRIPDDGIIDFILNNMDEFYDELSPTARDVFGIHKNKKGEIQVSTKKQWKIQMPQMYSVLSTLMNQKGDGELSPRPRTGDLAGWAFVKRLLLCMTPFHLRGGVAASNYKHHGMKNWICKMAAAIDGVFLKEEGKNGKRTKFIPRAKFNEEQEQCFRKYRILYCNALREFWQLSKRIIVRSDKYAELNRSLTSA